MRQIKFFVHVAFLLLLFSSCITRFDPEIKSSDAKKIVISGQVNRGEDVQRITISRTSGVDDPVFVPVTGCTVRILDDKGHSYNAYDVENGKYEAVIPESELIPGALFKVDIITPGGENIVSDFDKILDCPDVDSVYYSILQAPSVPPLNIRQGLQFYLDLDATNFSTRNFRWELVETWEYHSTYPVEWFYDGMVHHVVPPDYSMMICWQTVFVKDVFTLSTKNQTVNKHPGLPLHFVDNYTSSRLVYGYSLLIRQYAMSEEAFSYWEKLKTNSSTQGGLYEKQPLAVKGNLHNITHPEQEILGFFGAATVKFKRIFIRDSGTPLMYDPGCGQGLPVKGGLRNIPSGQYPAYLEGNASGYRDVVLNPRCVNCVLSGGTTVKPDFWPF